MATYKYSTLLLFTLLFSFSVFAQNDYLVGYKATGSGTDFTYHSPYSHNDPCLLSRARKSFEPISWFTEAVPETSTHQTVSFIWLYGMDVLPESQQFDMYINDDFALTFASPTSNDNEIWQVNGDNENQGILLTFNLTLIDKHGDQMGYAVLTLPSKFITNGKPIKITVDGHDNESNAWYMTYKIPLENKFTAAQLKTVTKKNGKLWHTVRFNIVHLGNPAHATVGIENVNQEITLKTGLNEIDFLVPKSDQKTTVKATVSILNQQIQEREVILEPVKEWTIYLVQHSHTDIGYTRPQSEILAEHLRYIDNALDYCDQTDHLPTEAQFRWTCEAAWTVKEYLDCRPQAQIERLVQRIEEGRIEVTGMFFNLSEIVDETGLTMQMQALKQFKDLGIEVTTAMQNDVNGIGWGLADYYHNTGVKYVTMGQHGHRARIPFNQPTAFWWESPSGKRLLAYRSEHYMQGNTLALISGDIDVFRDNLSKYLTELEQKQYPMDRVSLQFSGYITDNSPPSTKACDIVKQWNEKYEWPKLKLSIASEFMKYVEENHSDDLMVQRVAWPDWWTDGFGSAMNETKTSRTVHADMIANMGLLSMARLLGSDIPESITDDIDKCYEDLLFYDEHTFGAAESISDPSSLNSVNQWRQKASYVWAASQTSNLLREKATGLLQPFVEQNNVPTIVVYNTLNWQRNGVVEAFIDHDLLPLDKAFEIIDAKGNIIPAQLLSSRNEGSKWALWVEDIPPMGYATMEIHVFDKPATTIHTDTKAIHTMENEFYKLKVDTKALGITSLFDKELEQELTDADAAYSLSSFIYEELDNRSDLERLTYLNRDTVYKPLQKTITQLSDFTITKAKDGAIWSSLFINGQIPACADARGVDLEIRLYHHTKKIEFLYSMRKLKHTNPESVYIAFPFRLDGDEQLAFEAQGGVVFPGINQLEGTASDWNTIQNYAAVRSNNAQIVFCSNDVPLVQFGAINTGHYYYKHQPKTSHIYSWVLNNYWTTNFRASQEGELTWHYAITSTPEVGNTFATRFGWSTRIPMITSVLPAVSRNPNSTNNSLFEFDLPHNLLLVNAQPLDDGSGILLHLRETEGNNVVLDIRKMLQNPGITAIYETNALGEILKPSSDTISVEPWEARFVLLTMRK